MALLQSEVDTAKHWMARVMRPVMARGGDAWVEGDRKYLFLPLRDSTLPLPALPPEQGRREGTADLLQAFLPAAPRLSPSSTSVAAQGRGLARVGLSIDWEVVGCCLSFPVSSSSSAEAAMPRCRPLSVSDFDDDLSSLSQPLLVTVYGHGQSLLYRPRGISLLDASSRFPGGKAATYGQYYSQKGIRLPPSVPFVDAFPFSSHSYDLQRPPHRAGSVYNPAILPVTVCHVHVIPAPLFTLLKCVSSVMYSLECRLLTLSFLSASSLPIDLFPLIDSALVSANVSTEANYERLEFLGDCYLKYHFSSSVYSQLPPDATPAELTTKRTPLVQNSYLGRVGVERGLLSYMRVASYQKQLMGVAGLDGDERQHDVSLAVVADVVEALVGAAFLQGGDDACMKVCAFFDLPNARPLVTWPNGGDSGGQHSSPCAERFLAESLPMLEELFDHTFSSPFLPLCAFTHPSSHEGAGNYERLEFLGDAVLDWVITLQIFHSLPQSSPGEMTAVRQLLVSNSSYAQLLEGLGLVEVVIRETPGVQWVGDVMEAVMAAIYVDSGMDLQEVSRVWERIAKVEVVDGGGWALVAKRKLQLVPFGKRTHSEMG